MHLQAYHRMERHSIAADYGAWRGAIVDRFDAANPYSGSESVWTERAAWLDRNDRLALSRDELYEALTTYNRQHNDVPEVIASLRKLKEEGALVVTGGQQAGLFTGPMLVIHKAVTIILTARRSEQQLGRPVIPLFWIAGEDHDWDEVNHTYVLSRDHSITEINVAHPEGVRGKRTSISRTLLEPGEWEAALNALSAAMPDTEFKPELIERLSAIAAQSTTLSDAFAKTLSLLFGKYGLVLLDSDDEALRSVEAPMFGEIVRRQTELSAALQTGETAVESAGYPLQAVMAPDCANLFLFHDEERKLLFHREGGFADRKSTVFIEAQQLEQMAKVEPQLLSNNALTRPIMQEYVLPVLAVVLGPSEIAYWSTLKEAFHLFGMRMPIIIPRQEFTLLEGTIQKQMGQFGLTFEDAYERLEQLKEQWLREQDELGLEAKFSDVKLSFSDQYRPLIETVASINPGLGKLGETNMGKIIEQIEYFEKKALEGVKSKHEAGLRHWERIRLTVRPNGKPQERVFSVFQYINRYGFGWLDEWMSQLSIDFTKPYHAHDVAYL